MQEPYWIFWSEYGVLPEAARQIRTRVFVQEQGFQEEFDAVDTKSWHALLYREQNPCGTARIFYEDTETLHIGRVALLPAARGGGLGRALLDACAQKAQELDAKRLILGAQKQAQPFYEACGFTAFGNLFLDEGCPHRMMQMRLPEKENHE